MSQIWLKFEDRIITSIRSYQSKISKPDDYDKMKKLLVGLNFSMSRLNLETNSITSIQNQLREQFHEVLLQNYAEIFDAIIEKDNFTPLIVTQSAEEFEIYAVFPFNREFIGNSFVPVERLRDMASRPTIEISSIDAKKRKIEDGDLCKVFNDVGETFAHAIIKDSMLEGVASTQKQYRGSLVKNGLNVNALNTQDLTDMGDGPIFYTVLAQIKRV